VSNDINNRVATTVTIVPITSNVAKVYPFEVFLKPSDSGLPKPSKVQAQQIRTISKQRISGKAIGSLREPLMQSVNVSSSKSYWLRLKRSSEQGEREMIRSQFKSNQLK
jgi:mRNA interferase MazF